MSCQLTPVLSEKMCDTWPSSSASAIERTRQRSSVAGSYICRSSIMKKQTAAFTIDALTQLPRVDGSASLTPSHGMEHRCTRTPHGRIAPVHNRPLYSAGEGARFEACVAHSETGSTA
eukprot:4805919-Prymnesium_polylepis.2